MSVRILCRHFIFERGKVMVSGKIFKRSISLLLALSLIMSLLVFSTAASTRSGKDYGDVNDDELWWALKRLTGVATHIKGNAHPDDENNSTMAAMLLRDGIYSVCLTTTRGAGGQNAIGTEVDLAYSVVRSRELEEAMQTVHAGLEILCQEYDNTALDFGFSKRWEEPYEIWDWDVLLERIVRIFRTYRPDIFIEQGSLARSQHGQHQAVALLCYAGFLAAADPTMFPDQITVDGLAPWRIPFFGSSNYTSTTAYTYATFPNDFAGGYFAGVNMGGQESYQVRYQAGNYVDPVLGVSSNQLSSMSRRFHISQGMGGSIPAPGAQSDAYSTSYVQGGRPAGYPATVDLFDPVYGVPRTLADLAKTGDAAIDAAFVNLQADVDGIIAAYPNKAAVLALVHGMIENVNSTLGLVNASTLSDDVKYDLNHRLNRKLDELSNASHQAAVITARINPETFTPYAGQNLVIPVEFANNGDVRVNVTGVELNVPAGWVVTGTANTGLLNPGSESINNFSVAIPTTALFEPYKDQSGHTPVSATITYDLPSVPGSTATYTFFYNNNYPNWQYPYERFAVMPQYGLTLLPDKYAVNTVLRASDLPVEIEVESFMPGASQDVEVFLDAPAGWTVTPASVNLNFSAIHEIKSAEFTVSPPADFGEERVVINASAVRDGVVSNTTVQVIEYEHIGRTYFLYPSDLVVQGMEVAIPKDLKIGYVDSDRDLVYLYLEQIGFDVTLLSDSEIENGDLSIYDTIYVGTRGYASRSVLRTQSDKLKAYVAAGGNMVVNYHQSSGDSWNMNYAPYPLTIGASSANFRVVEENAEVTYLVPTHPILNYPNVIVDTDWDGWVQERAIYCVDMLSSNTSSAWTGIIQAMDTDDDIIAGRRVQDGMITWAEYGDGMYTYNSVVWYRQIQALVPGAFRILTNIITQTYDGEILDNKGKININGPDSVISGPGATAEYMISAEKMDYISGIELEFQVDGDYLSSLSFEPQGDFFFSNVGNYGTPIWWSNSGNIWTGKATLLNFAGINNEFDILKMAYNVTPGVLGSTDVILKSVKVSYMGNDATAELGKDVATTVFEQWYSPYDLTKDGVIDLNDITYALQYVPSFLGDPNWDEAQVADVNHDDKVDIADLILILNNYTVPYY